MIVSIESPIHLVINRIKDTSNEFPCPRNSPTHKGSRIQEPSSIELAPIPARIRSLCLVAGEEWKGKRRGEERYDGKRKRNCRCATLFPCIDSRIPAELKLAEGAWLASLFNRPLCSIAMRRNISQRPPICICSEFRVWWYSKI